MNYLKLLEIIQIKRATYWSDTVTFVTATGALSREFDGKEYKLTVKNPTDTASNDDSALIEKTGTVSNGTILLEFSPAETDLTYGKFKADIRIQTSEASDDNQNTDTFFIEIVKKVTQE